MKIFEAFVGVNTINSTKMFVYKHMDTSKIKVFGNIFIPTIISCEYVCSVKKTLFSNYNIICKKEKKKGLKKSLVIFE